VLSTNGTFNSECITLFCAKTASGSSSIDWVLCTLYARRNWKHMLPNKFWHVQQLSMLCRYPARINADRSSTPIRLASPQTKQTWTNQWTCYFPNLGAPTLQRMMHVPKTIEILQTWYSWEYACPCAGANPGIRDRGKLAPSNVGPGNATLHVESSLSEQHLSSRKCLEVYDFSCFR